jgi:hypothetical protein
MISTFEKLQQAVVARLKRRSDMEGVPVLARNNGSIAAKVREKVASRGLCVVVMPPRPKDIATSATAPVFTQITLCVRVIESAYKAHTGMDAVGVAEIVSRALQAWTPQVTGITAALSMDSDDAWSMDDEPDKEGRYTIEINFVTSATV